MKKQHMYIKTWLRSGIFALLFPVLFWTACGQQQKNSPFPEGTKRILFLGNSITYAGTYINDLETYFLIRYPENSYEWVNAGLPSETVSGLSEEGHAGGEFPKPCLHERLTRVLDAVRPEVVFACYGMNDGMNNPVVAEERFEPYRKGLERLDTILKSYAVKEIIYLTPPIRVEKEKGLEGYNVVLDAYSEWLLAQRENAGWRVIDLHFPMKRYYEEQRSLDPSFALAPDGIHPLELGHWLMAREILRGLGETDAADAPDILSALNGDPKEETIYELVSQRQAIMKDAWLTTTGHLRPRMKTGLPMAEARMRYDETEARIRELLNDRNP